MNFIILLNFLATLACFISATTVNTQQKNGETNNKNINSLTSAPQKMQTFYVPMVHQQPLVNYIQRPYPQQQATILFIAQPQLPQQLFQHPVAQQLLNYFHSNPQAKYQFLHGPSPTAQSYMQQPIQPDLYAAHHHQIAQLNYPQVPQTQQYRHLVQENVYQNVPSYQQHNPGHSAYKTAPPIITGLEHFSPEQQAEIKEQLSSHFGSPLTQINSNSFQVVHSPQNKYSIDETKAELKNQTQEKRNLRSKT